MSVCIPTYNRAALLRPFLQSILSQTLTDFEVIVSDNCSTDDTPAIVSALTDARLVYHRNETNIGPFRNMNLLLGLARGDYLCIVHDDDLYAPTFLERLSEMLDRHPSVGMVHCAAYEVEPDGTKRGLVRAYPTTRVLDGDREFVLYLQGHNVCCSSVMARRTLYLEAGPFDTELLCSDYLMWLNFALRADVAYVAEPLLDMRVHPDNVSSWLNPARWHREYMMILERGLEMAGANKPALLENRKALLVGAARTQGRRFLTAELAAVARGDFDLARQYHAVLERLREIGLSRVYLLAGDVLNNRLGRRALSVVAGVRRARARRLTEPFHGRAS